MNKNNKTKKGVTVGKGPGLMSSQNKLKKNQNRIPKPGKSTTLWTNQYGDSKTWGKK
jgi:hypothetical protein